MKRALNAIQKKNQANKSKKKNAITHTIMSEFPIVCDRCLGNPSSSSYMRMTKRTNGAECRFCQRVFTPFHWKRGGVTMKTEICGVCATIRHLCQSCLLDMDLSVPQYVRDAAQMDENVAFQLIQDTSSSSSSSLALTASSDGGGGRGSGGGGDGSHRSTDYKSDAKALLANTFSSQSAQQQHKRSQVTSAYLAEQADRMLSEGGLNSHLLLDEMAPNSSELLQMLNQSTSSVLQQQQRQQQQQQLRQLRQQQEEKSGSSGKNPPENTNIRSLYIGGIQSSMKVSRDDILKVLSPFGKVEHVNIVSNKHCAFVTFEKREDAENCIEQLYGKLMIHGSRLHLSWGRQERQPNRGDAASASSGSASSKLKQHRYTPYDGKHRRRDQQSQEKSAMIEFLKNPELYLRPPPGATEQQAPVYPSMTVLPLQFE